MSFHRMTKHTLCAIIRPQMLRSVFHALWLLAVIVLLSACDKSHTQPAAHTPHKGSPRGGSFSLDAIEVSPHETNEDWPHRVRFSSDEGVVCVLFGYGFNGEDFYTSALAAIEEQFGLADNGGLVLPVVFPDDLHGRVSNLRDVVEKNNLRAMILLGAPEDTHLTLVRIIEGWEETQPFNIFSLFPQDDVLGEEFSCNFVLDFEAASGVVLDEERQRVDDEALYVLCQAVEYAALLPYVLKADGDLYSHVQAIVGSKKVLRYTDSETGIQSKNHFVIRAGE